MAEKSTTVISLPQMVDLALNSPEVGIVNFTVLHSLLHVIVNQLDLGEINVEFRGSDSERLQNYIATAKPGPIVTLTEYTVGPDGKGRKKRRASKRKSNDEKGKKDENQKEKKITILKTELSATDSESSGSFKTIVVVEPASREKLGDAPKFTIGLTKEQLSKLQKDIKVLQNQVKELTEMPGNIGLIDAIRSSKDGNNSPLLDMFQILTLTKRLDATEAALSKLASMMEDLAKGQASLIMESGRQSAVGFKDDVEPPSQEALDLVAKTQRLRESLDIVSTEQGKELENLESRITQLEQAVSALQEGWHEEIPPTKQDQSKDVSELRSEGDYDITSADLSKMPTAEAIVILQKELINLKEQMVNDLETEAFKEFLEMKDVIMSQENEKNVPPDVKFGQMDLRIKEVKNHISKLDTNILQFGNLRDKITHLENEIVAVWERINHGISGGDAGAGMDAQNISELYQKIIELQDDMNIMAETAQKLVTEKDARQNTLEIMAEQIELLKTVKADREDLEDALADKADACQINRKVSHEQFDAAYDEITKALEDNLEKLKQQEELWIQSLNDLQREIGNKLDRMELIPLKDFINAKLKGIQDKVKKMSTLRRENEAAGTKSKVLRNVNCISCDADVVMKRQTDITMFPKPYAMPVPKSPGPYLAYELDQLRRQQKSLPSNKNLNMFESAMQFGKMKTSAKDHICNRYCGGSHTVTTPEQRVMRVGHFMEQWGPEISPVNEVLIKGTDGHLYKGRDDALLRALANDKPPSAKMKTPTMVIKECGTTEDNQYIKTDDKPDNLAGGSQDSTRRNRPNTSIDNVSDEQNAGKSPSIKRSYIRSAPLK